MHPACGGGDGQAVMSVHIATGSNCPVNVQILQPRAGASNAKHNAEVKPGLSGPEAGSTVASTKASVDVSAGPLAPISAKPKPSTKGTRPMPMTVGSREEHRVGEGGPPPPGLFCVVLWKQ